MPKKNKTGGKKKSNSLIVKELLSLGRDELFKRQMEAARKLACVGEQLRMHVGGEPEELIKQIRPVLVEQGAEYFRYEELVHRHDTGHTTGGYGS